MDSYSIILEEDAIDDLQNTIKYNAEINVKLSDDFLAEFKALTSLIGQFPTLFGIRYRDVRVARIQRFKTLILFLTDENLNQIKILRILRENRNWQELL